MKKTNLLFIILLFLTFATSGQNPGDIDEDWAENGTSWFSFEDQYHFANCLGMQSNQKIISAGYLFNNEHTESYFFAYRINPNGSLDDFGNQGDHFLLNHTGIDNAKCMYINPDDEIFLVSITLLTDILKLSPEGELDETFGDAGIAQTDLLSDVKDIKAFPFESFEHLILCGSTINPGETTPGISIIFEDGSENEYFGEDGVASIEGLNGYFSSVYYLPETEEIYACGIKFETRNKLLIAKYTFEGELDPNFGDGGYIVEDFPIGVLEFYNPRLVYDEVHDHLIIGSYILWAEGDTDIQLRKVDSNGEPVSSFGNDGWVHITMPYSNEIFSSLALQEDGMIYFAGSTSLGDTEDFLLGKVNMDGELDENFGENGIVEYDHMDRVNLSNDVILNPDEGRLILGGTSRTVDNSESVMTISKFFTGVYTGFADRNSQEAIWLQITPNPVTDHFNITVNQEITSDLKIAIYSLNGKKVYETTETLSNGQTTVEGLNIEPGCYLLSLKCQNQILNKKILIK